MFKYDDDSIKAENGYIVMHRWETPIMKMMAEWACANTGDILEVGYGMGICANFIQQHPIVSHTIVEKDPEVFEKLQDWSKDKPNVKLIKGDWYKNQDKLETYDGIMFDTYADMNIHYFKKELVWKISKEETNLAIWDEMHDSVHPHFPNNPLSSLKIDVDIPKEHSYNYLGSNSDLYLHRIKISNPSTIYNII
mgnify:FL=1|tara:strand:- start:462 stop:1043 length:582 start_codon:yes stop_codon:yes gene_type:complete